MGEELLTRLGTKEAQLADTLAAAAQTQADVYNTLHITRVPTRAELAGRADGAYIITAENLQLELRNGAVIAGSESPVMQTVQQAAAFVRAPTLGVALRLAAQGSSLTVNAEGDSLTYGQDETAAGQDTQINGAGQKRSPTPWPESLQTALGFLLPGAAPEVRNRGFPGDRTVEGLNRWLGATGGDVTIMMYGTNDANNYGGYPDGPLSVQTYQDNLGALIERRRAQGQQVILLGPPPIQDATGTRRIRANTEAARTIAQRYGAIFVDTAELLAGLPAAVPIWSDGVHLSPQAYALIGWRLAALFGPSGAAPPLVSAGSIIRPRDNAHGGTAAVIEDRGATVWRLARGQVLMIPFRAQGRLRPVAEIMSLTGRVEQIYYGNAAGLSPNVTSGAGEVYTDAPGHDHSPGLGLLILRALDGDVNVRAVRFDDPGAVALPLSPTLILGTTTTVRPTSSLLAGRVLNSLAGSGDWRFAGDPQADLALREGRVLSADLRLSEAGLGGLALISAGMGGGYGFGTGWFIRRAGGNLQCVPFTNGTPGAEQIAAEVFAAGPWAGLLSVQYTAGNLRVWVDGADRIALPAAGSYLPGLLAGFGASVSCRTLSVG